MDLRNNRFRRRGNDEPHTSALNDILFILMFFFLIIATLANPNVVKLSNPKAQSDTKAKQTVVVSIDSLQQYYVGTKLTLADSLGSAITAAVQATAGDTDRSVVINADKKANAESIVTVMKAARAQKLRSVLAVGKE